ncbi:RagB/SusD family nutrient uptake outer membrane protein [Parapedobacter soli]|uniref:RagB/SusD family nutrient uptake outer membrane protein n=1 Tax=Parapedobacter soli TaxID=416955 RepID=UPI0021CA35C8|nr:RagB/SusD family nutrient uptake outer membrane protein [Parapedobacter soli]
MKKMKYLSLAFAMVIGASACNKDSLDLVNPNSPGMASLQTEEGIRRAALGVYDKFGLEYWWLALQNHDLMGDAYFASVGNFGWRWLNQPTSMTLSNGTVLTPPQGGSQVDEVLNRNGRAFGEDNALQYEWQAMYLVNNQANLILAALEDPNLSFSASGEMKTNVLRAWAYWWKGFAYSRIGSLYIAGIIANTLNETNSDFVTHEEIIAEANRNFDQAISVLNGMQGGEAYNDFFTSIIPSFTNAGKGGAVSPQEWIRNINTYKARNLVVNKEVSEMTSADWQQVLTLTESGMQANDKTFTMRSALQNDLVSETAWQPFRSTVDLWSHISERLIQDYKPGDNRFERNYTTEYPTYPIINAQARGFNYSTRYGFIRIEDGGDYSTQVAGLAEITIAGAYEENQLMRAEALIRTGNIDGGLELIDEVRDYQNAQLDAVAGTGLTEAEALEELRSERRVGLLNKNVAFYDARRWGVLKPVSEGGGRSGAVVLYIPSGATSYVVDENATIDYNYLSWWPVPDNEIDLNEPSVGSAPVTVR